MVAAACCDILSLEWLLLHAVDVHTQRVIAVLSSLLSFVCYTQQVIAALSSLLRNAMPSPPAGHLTSLLTSPPRHCSTFTPQMGSFFVAHGMRVRARPLLSST